MRLWMGSMLIVMFAAMPLLGQGNAGEEKGNDRAAQAKAIRSDYQRAVTEVRKSLRADKTDEEQQEILTNLTKRFTPRFLKFIEDDPQDQWSLRMVILALQGLPSVDGKFFDLLVQHWTKNESEDNQLLCKLLILRPLPDAKKFLQKALEANKSKDIQGLTCFALAKMANAKAHEGDKKAGEEAEKYYARVAKDFAAVKLDTRTTLGEQAKIPLFAIRHLSIGKTPPNVESQNLDGTKASLKDYKGKVVVLDIWATWCPPCRGMIPHERAMVKKHKGKPFVLISVSADEEKADLKKFLETNDMPWVHWWDGAEGNIIKGWDVQSFPTIYVLDAAGVIRYKFVEVVDKELDEAVEKLLAEVENAK